MDKNFWLEKWKTNEIAFHERDANPLLVKHFHELDLPKGSRVFLPLCGKTSAILWLLAQGCHVVGAELSEIAIQQLFAEAGIAPSITAIGEMRRFNAENIEIFVGDFFSLTSSVLGPVDAIYDRAALVALSEVLRKQYSSHLMEVTAKAPQLLITFNYDQSLLEPPPFSISKEEVERHYGARYRLRLLDSVDVQGGLKGKCPAVEDVWLLQ